MYCSSASSIMYVPVLHRDLVSLVSTLSTSGSIKQHFGFSELLVSVYFKLTSEQHPNKCQTFPSFNSPARLVSITQAHRTKTIIQAGVIPLTNWPGTVYCFPCWGFLPVSLKLHLIANELLLPSSNVTQVQGWSEKPGSSNRLLCFLLPRMQ